MDNAIQTGLIGTVANVIDFQREFPGGLFGDDIGLDVQLKGEPVAVGQKIILSTPSGSEELLVKGIEMLGDISNPYTVRIHCNRPRCVSVHGEGVADWLVVHP
jgi:hypothetical protein